MVELAEAVACFSFVRNVTVNNGTRRQVEAIVRAFHKLNSSQGRNVLLDVGYVLGYVVTGFSVLADHVVACVALEELAVEARHESYPSYLGIGVARVDLSANLHPRMVIHLLGDDGWEPLSGKQ